VQSRCSKGFGVPQWTRIRAVATLQ